MKLKCVLSLLMLCALNVQAQENITINVTGAIVLASCSVSTASQSFTINLGNTYNTRAFRNAGMKTPFVPFSIDVECDSNFNDVGIQFSGAKDSNNTDLLALTSGGAQNVGVGIFNKSDESLIPLESPSIKTNLLANQIHSFEFLAAYVTTGPVTAGPANAEATFNLIYN